MEKCKDLSALGRGRIVMARLQGRRISEIRIVGWPRNAEPIKSDLRKGNQ